MALPNRSLSSSSERFNSEDEWGGGGRERLTAVEELRGHLDDCLSLYRSRFSHTDFSLSFARTINPNSADALVDLQRGAVQLSSGLSSAAASSFPHNGDLLECSAAVDVSTAATILFLCDGAKAATPGAPLGVVVAFHYYGGFVPCAERRFHGTAEVEECVEELMKGTWTVAELMHGEHGWTALSDNSDTAAALKVSNDAEGPPADETCEAEPAGAGYESLMSLLVHRYL